MIVKSQEPQAHPLEVPPYLAIIGPTASGKSQLAFQLAVRLGGEIVSCDSVQLVKGFDIGSAKPSWEQRQAVPHHLLDIITGCQAFDAAQYAQLARAAIADIARRGKLALVVGGSGFYLRSLWGEAFHDLPADHSLRQRLMSQEAGVLYRELQSRDPKRALEIHPHDKFRLARALEIIELSGQAVSSLTSQQTVAPFPPRCVLMLDPPRVSLHQRIALRSEEMLAQGLLAETAHLLAQGCPPEAKAMGSIGYRQASLCLAGHLAREQLLEKIIVATRQYAKRQMTWFRRVRVDIRCTESPELESVQKLIEPFFMATEK